MLPRRCHVPRSMFCVSRQRTWRRALAAEAGQWLRAPKRRQLPALLAAQDPGGGAACDLACALTAGCSSTTLLCGTAAELARARVDASPMFLGSSARTAVSKFGVERKPQTKLNHQNTTNKLVQAATPGAKFLHGRNMCTLAACGNANQGLAKLRMAKLRRLPLVCTCDVGTDCAPEAPLACCLW